MFESSGSTLLSPANLAIVPMSYAEPPYWPISGWRGSAKRLADIVIALVLLVMFSPIALLAVLAIRLEGPGPIVFHQRRIGFANVGFTMFKFRTMRHHSQLSGKFRQTTRHDPRVTRVGTILRHLSLDEYPQLLNVLRGDMSMVGPRPHAPGSCAGGKPFELVTPHYAARHRVRPGMTGLAQVRGWRGGTETEDKLLRRIESDLEYIDTWSLWRDAVILARTAVSVSAMRNAY